MKIELNDKDVNPPTIYTHHDNAIKALDGIKMMLAKARMSPNLRFDNSPARDNKMYEISDLTNLRNEPSKNDLDKYLELENIVPKARFRAVNSNSNFASGSTLQQKKHSLLSSNRDLAHMPTQLGTFKTRSNTIVYDNSGINLESAANLLSSR